MDFSITITKDFLDKVQVFIEDEKFIHFCLNNNEDLSIPAFILTTLFNQIDEYRLQLDRKENL